VVLAVHRSWRGQQTADAAAQALVLRLLPLLLLPPLLLPLLLPVCVCGDQWGARKRESTSQ
jgi:hypothetical protein